ncbi:hypothetical protein ABZZ79_34210, partial [Streptomyces sp. NPDC006458]
RSHRYPGQDQRVRAQRLALLGGLHPDRQPLRRVGRASQHGVSDLSDRANGYGSAPRATGKNKLPGQRRDRVGDRVFDGLGAAAGRRRAVERLAIIEDAARRAGAMGGGVLIW